MSPTPHDTAVSVLGTGAIGGRVVEALLAAGTSVTVWNRSPERAAPFSARGAVLADSATQAVSASPLILLPVTDYDAVEHVLTATSAVLSGRTVVALTTGTPDEARAAARAAERAGATYLDGAVQTAPDDIGTAAATFLYSGPRDVFEAHRALLAQFGRTDHVGSDPAAAAVQDLALFGLWYDAQIGYLRALDIVRDAGVDVETFAQAAAAQLGHVVAAAADTAREMTTRSYPRGAAGLAEHAPLLDTLVAQRAGRRLGDGDLPLIASLVRRRIAHSGGAEGLTSIVDRG